MKHRLERAAQQVIDRLQLTTTGPIVVGLSGGADSTALAALLAEAGCDTLLVHVDHGLRPADSRADREWCQQLAAELCVPIRVVSADVRPSGKGLEAAARDARFEALAREARRVDARWVALGHNRNDQAETILLRLLRGSGLRGLAGMSDDDPSPWRDPRVRVARPLLTVEREAIRTWCRERSLDYREDPSNRSPAFQRNRVRHELMPLLTELNARSVDHVLGLGGDARAAQQVLDEHVASLLDSVFTLVDGQAHLLRAGLVQQPSAVRRAVLHTVWDRLEAAVPLSRRQIDAADLAVLQGRGGMDLPHNWVMRVEADHVVVEQSRGVSEWVTFGRHLVTGERFEHGPWAFTFGPASGAPSRDLGELRIDTSELGRLAVRQWCDGDRIALTSGGRVKLQDLFTDRKVPVLERRTWPVMVDQVGSVVWVPGLKRAPREVPTGRSAIVVKVTRNTSRGPDVYSTDEPPA